MEEALMNAADILLLAMEKATQPGLVEAPDALVAAIEAHADPMQALSDWDARDEIFGAIRSRFSFVDFVRTNDELPNDKDFDKLTGLLRWIIREGAAWDSSADPRRIRLIAVFVASQFITVGTNFWAIAPNGFKPNDELLAALEGMITSMKMSFTTRGLSPPIWELEAVERFEKADTESDWIGIAQGWRLIQDGFFPGIAVAQAAQCLDRFSPQRLAQAVSNLRQTAPIMSVILSLTPLAALRLGAESTNHHVQFASAYGAVSSRVNRESLDDMSKAFLIQILETVSKDTPRWISWMRVFNFIPSHFPELQVPLGCALANADNAALQAYIDAISLHGSGQHTRFAVVDCLRTFRDKAEVKKRRILWNLAYQRWTSWRFGLNEAGQNLIKIARCELDYALVGYIVECLDDAQRQHMLASFIRRLETVEDTWHPGITDCISEWNAVLSEMQPLCLAMNIADPEADWIDQGATMRLPFDPDKEIYVILKYGRPEIA